MVEHETDSPSCEDRGQRSAASGGSGVLCAADRETDRPLAEEPGRQRPARRTDQLCAACTHAPMPPSDVAPQPGQRENKGPQPVDDADSGLEPEPLEERSLRETDRPREAAADAAPEPARRAPIRLEFGASEFVVSPRSRRLEARRLAVDVDGTLRTLWDAIGALRRLRAELAAEAFLQPAVARLEARRLAQGARRAAEALLA
jgi:hypothetical protein